jgi:hypothetical protein
LDDNFLQLFGIIVNFLNFVIEVLANLLIIVPVFSGPPEPLFKFIDYQILLLNSLFNLLLQSGQFVNFFGLIFDAGMRLHELRLQVSNFFSLGI